MDYLNNTYLPATALEAEQSVEEKTQAVYRSVLADLDARHSAYLARAEGGGSGSTGALADQRYKRGDVISLSSGSGLLLLAGSAAVGYPSGGAVIDVTAGQVVGNGSALAARHYYLAGEYTTAAVTITSDTAVISAEGSVALSPSGEVDYNALAGALKELGLFRGSATAYGSGYDLELAPTRIEGLVMFLRLMGEEEAALSYQGSDPFWDTPEWCRRYTAYAYDKGYTKGVGEDEAGRLCFGTSNPMTAGEYLTFLLRALGYSDSGDLPDFTWEDAVGKSAVFGVITPGEQRMLSEKPFLRAQVAYTSYFALSAPRKSGETLLAYLTASGALDSGRVLEVMGGVTVPRL
ncbi:MAG: hypothetical protein HFF17_16800 [Oscillospiraceae bacterium]|nr:hypothetical protein [Oscillospiraceae bacterium]